MDTYRPLLLEEEMLSNLKKLQELADCYYKKMGVNAKDLDNQV